MQQLGELEEDRDKYEEKGVQLMALAVQAQVGAANTLKPTEAQYPVLADTDHAVADAYNVFDLLPSDTRAATPSVFIIGKDRRIIWVEVSEERDQRTKSETILANLP